MKGQKNLLSFPPSLPDVWSLLLAENCHIPLQNIQIHSNQTEYYL